MRESRAGGFTGVSGATGGPVGRGIEAGTNSRLRAGREESICTLTLFSPLFGCPRVRAVSSLFGFGGCWRFNEGGEKHVFAPIRSP